ncbi:hypothetical protein I4U23_004981 [Adineta vaga]|nr:hypothetical protein I4U23_004981 [Adineta vaga]
MPLGYNSHSTRKISRKSFDSYASPKSSPVRQRHYSGSSCYESDLSDVSIYELEWQSTKSSKKKCTTLKRPKLIRYIDENIIGKDFVFNGPWGSRRMIYCDYTASGRALTFIEDFIKNMVLPLYSNIHNESNVSGRQIRKYVEESRNLIKKSVNANENDILLFTGTGSTGAIHILVKNLNIKNEINKRNTIIMVSTFEHHSNILPWRETGAKLIRIPLTQEGLLDKAFLKKQLQYYFKLKKRIICSFNAASNVTGICTDVDSISSLVHSYNGLIFWDYAAAAPHLKIDMNSSLTAYKDGIFISTHKFIGGPSTPGILIVKKNLFQKDHSCIENDDKTNLIGCIRSGLVFQLKDSLDINYIHTREEQLVKRFFHHCRKLENLIILGSQTVQRLPIFSFLIYVPTLKKYLHHNFIALLFNDLFGIQVRSGCACAGPYALDLLNITDDDADIYMKFITEENNRRESDIPVRTVIMKPGFTRLNLPYFTSDDDINFIFDAVEFIATHGWKFLPLYIYDPVSGIWKHRNGFQLNLSSLEDITYSSNKMQSYTKNNDSSSTRLPDPFRLAELLAANVIKNAIVLLDYTSNDPPLNIPVKYKHLIWFALPIEIASLMIEDKQKMKKNYLMIHKVDIISISNMFFRLFIIFTLFHSLSGEISCYDCSSVPHMYNYSITAETMPKAFDDCSIKSNQTMCYISFRSLLSSNQTEIIVTSTGKRMELFSSSPPKRLLTAATDIRGSGSNPSFEHAFTYFCSSEKCNDIGTFKRILQSLTITVQFADLKNLLESVEPFDGHWCLMFSNQTSGDACDVEIPANPQNCKICSTRYMEDSEGHRMCAGCFTHGRNMPSIIYQVQFDMNDRTWRDHSTIKCQSKNCNGIETMNLIQEKTMIQFNFDRFFNTAQKNNLNMTVLYFMMIVSLIRTVFLI